jgi:hypothetical protein
LKAAPNIITDPEIRGGIGYLINGQIHISVELYKKWSLFPGVIPIPFIDTDEINYKLHLDQIKLFAGQQVHVFDNGFLIGEGTITAYPLNHDFTMAEVCLHDPFRGETSAYPAMHLVPVC